MKIHLVYQEVMRMLIVLVVLLRALMASLLQQLVPLLVMVYVVPDIMHVGLSNLMAQSLMALQAKVSSQ